MSEGLENFQSLSSFFFGGFLCLFSPSLAVAGQDTLENSLCERRNPKVLVYNRVPKCGSSTMLRLLDLLSLRNNFTVVRLNSTSDYYRQDVLSELIQEALVSESKSVIAEHFYYPGVHADGLEYINMVREPADRCISHYYYLRASKRASFVDLDSSIVMYGNYSFDECLDRTERNEVDTSTGTCIRRECLPSYEARHFCEHGCQNCTEAEVLGTALLNLQQFYTVGIAENMLQALEVFEFMYPSFFEGSARLFKEGIEYANVNTERQPAMANTQKRIRKKLNVDNVFYQAAISRIEYLHSVCSNLR